MKKIANILVCLLLVCHVFAQNSIRVNGIVFDENSEVLPGVIINIDNKPGCITDFDGKFEMQATDTSIITFSYIGYNLYTTHVPLNGYIEVHMEPERFIEFGCTVPRLYLYAGLLFNNKGLPGGSLSFRKVYADCYDTHAILNGKVEYNTGNHDQYLLRTELSLSDLKYLKSKRFGISAEYDWINTDRASSMGIKGKFIQQDIYKALTVSEILGYRKFDSYRNFGIGLDAGYYWFFSKPHITVSVKSAFITWKRYDEFQIQTLFSKDLPYKAKGLIRINTGLEYRNIKNYSELSILLRLDFRLKSITFI